MDDLNPFPSQPPETFSSQVHRRTASQASDWPSETNANADAGFFSFLPHHRSNHTATVTRDLPEKVFVTWQLLGQEVNAGDSRAPADWPRAQVKHKSGQR